jgi:transcriptional/translational regulatory protein YebC/TACO1
MPDALQIVTSVASEPEGELIVERLKEAGISAISQRTIGGARNVFVDEQDLERAREVLAADEGTFSDEELARLSEEAVQKDSDPSSKPE